MILNNVYISECYVVSMASEEITTYFTYATRDGTIMIYVPRATRLYKLLRTAIERNGGTAKKLKLRLAVSDAEVYRETLEKA